MGLHRLELLAINTILTTFGDFQIFEDLVPRVVELAGESFQFFGPGCPGNNCFIQGVIGGNERCDLGTGGLACCGRRPRFLGGCPLRFRAFGCGAKGVETAVQIVLLGGPVALGSFNDLRDRGHISTGQLLVRLGHLGEMEGQVALEIQPAVGFADYGSGFIERCLTIAMLLGHQALKAGNRLAA